MFDNIINRIMPITLSRGIDIAYRLAARTKPKKKPKNWYRHPIENLMEFIGTERVGDPGPCTREELVQLGDIPVGDVTLDMMLRWYDWLKTYRARTGNNEYLSPRTRDSYARMARAYFNKLVEAGHLDASPMRRMVLPKPPRKAKQDIDQDSLELMVRHSKRHWRDHAIVLILRDSGCRVGELCSMRLSALAIDEDDDGQLVGMAEVLGKGDKIRHIFFGDAACRALRHYLDFRPYFAGDELWLSLNGGTPLTTDGVYQVLRRVAEEAGVTVFNPHSFRHAFAKWHIERGTPMKVIQELMGHEDLSTTYNEYVQYDNEELKRLFKKYGRDGY